MKIRLAAPLTTDSIVDGTGLRTVIWTQGCTHNCFGCQNPETHNIYGGFESDIDDIKNKLRNLKLQKGITLSGGEPFLQVEPCTQIAKFAHSIGLDVWCFSGFTYEEIKNDMNKIDLLKNIDVLVDGKFIQSKKTLDLKFRGSENQRIIYLKNGDVLNIQ